ncbi:translesion error-prone DNA polymerase V autoproteolytic subunit [Methylomonas sp. AM2-LC]|uniref:LexA family protein n=1 Tax=Methylomonas sp. AM2-LC TaxID=3153301 RepID=UPI0032657CAB
MNSASLLLPQLQYSYQSAYADLRSDSLHLPFLPLQQMPLAMAVPLFGSKIPAGFPSPADDHLEASIDLNQQYVRNPSATFFVRVQGHSMIGAGINNNDMLVVDRSLEAKSGAIVIAVVNGELTVKRLLIEPDRVLLMPENPDYQPIVIKDFMDLHIWGVVAHVIHTL